MKAPLTLFRRLICALVALLVSTMPEAFSQEAAEVKTLKKWEVADFLFKSETPHENPFQVDFMAIVTPPKGAPLNVRGFFNGDGTWVLRISPEKTGDWKIRTQSSDPNLSGIEQTFICSEEPAPGAHGPLKVDPDHPHHFIYADGTRHFLLGYECDWLWALDVGNNKLPAVSKFLDTLKAHGFNHILINTYAHDTSWMKGKTSDDDYGPPPLFAWEGDNEKPDHSWLNLSFWKHYDRVIGAMNDRNITAHIMIKVYNKKVKWPQRLNPEDDLFFRWVVARYAAFPNIVWDFSKESYNEKDPEYKFNRLRLVKDEDPYDRLITVHDDDKIYNDGGYDKLLDFQSDQQHKDWYGVIRKQREQRAWPVVNVEYGYEHGLGGPEDIAYRVAQSPEEVAMRAWEVCMAGGYPAYYYTWTAWDVIKPEQVPPGYKLHKILKDYIEGTAYWQLEPVDGVASAGICLQSEQGETIVFLRSGQTVHVKPKSPSDSYLAEWFQPFSGEKLQAGEVTGDRIELTSPAEWSKAPAVLYLKKKG